MKQRLQQVFTSARERGAVMFLVVATVLIVLIAGAVAVDLSITSSRGQSLQNAADAAALAGVQAYRESMGSATVATAADEDAARDAVGAILAANGISLAANVSFPDQTNFTQVEVELIDNDPGTLMGGVTGSEGAVKRSATAEFERCDDDCINPVTIPEPFTSVDATGNGDGYKPIPVGNKLYALNHHVENAQMVCVSRVTQSACWTDIYGNPVIERPAYPSGYTPTYTPELVHTAVIDTRIYWTSSLSTGHYMFCWETVTDTPCSSPYQINNRPFATGGDFWAMEQRGGGTFAYDGRIFTFTDDHRVHCIEPIDDNTLVMTGCFGYGGNGLQTSLGVADFPTNEVSDGNSGGAIDRIIDEENGLAYATIHIDTRVPTGPIDCVNPLTDPADQTVVIESEGTGRFIYATSSNGNRVARMSSDGNDESDQWRVTVGPNGEYRFESVRYDGYYLDWDAYEGYRAINLVGSGGIGWILQDAGGVFQVLNFNASRNTNWLDASGYSSLYESSYVDSNSYNKYWNFWPAECGEANFNPGPGLPEPTLSYEAGTWVHCWDLVAGIPCANFTPLRMHVDSHPFSGRLFFYRDSAAVNPGVTGLCSTGFAIDLGKVYASTSTDFSDYAEVACVDNLTGAYTAQAMNQEARLQTFEQQMADTVAGVSTNGNGEIWGSWGDPHWNESSNRVFYPTQRANSRVLCFDFDTETSCNWVEGASPSAPGQMIQDYGFFSEGLCVYGLGHNARFWAFKADNPGSECTGSFQETVIEPCNCGGNLYWGTVTFDVDLDLFDEFLIEIYNSSGDRVVPAPYDWEDPQNPESPAHNLKTDGVTIDLNALPISGPDDFLRVGIYVDANNNPWSQGEQSFVIELARTPRLTE